MIGLGDHRSGHDGRLCEESSHDVEGKGSVRFVGGGSARGGCHDRYRDYHEGREGDHGQNRIARRRKGAFEPTERC